MDAKYIRPIPKYIEKKIRALDKEVCPEQKGLRFYAYLTTIRKELVKITVAMRNKSKKMQLIKQVAVHGVYSDNCLVRDMEYCYLGIYAYRVGWYDEGEKYPYGLRPYYNDGRWYSVPFKYYNPWATVVNPDYPLKLAAFRYSAIELQKPVCPITYLRTYLQYPQVEYLVKLGLGKFIRSKMILQRIGKDKRFCKWLIANKTELRNKHFYIDVVLRSYRTGKPLDALQAYRAAKIKLANDNSLKPIRDMFEGRERERFFDYILRQKTNAHTYLDYLKACNDLGLDMTEEKNRFPHDFKRWHDIRIDQYATKKAEEDKEKRKELYEKFAAVAEKYLTLQGINNKEYAVFIARSPADLIREGEILNHCVGRMNYDRKFVREESLIFFVRHIAEPDTPFVTVEYSLSQKKILQCYGNTDTKPDDSVLHYVNKVWLPHANRQLKKLNTQAAA
ncbi:MAG: PcfJ domain-containing protein [Eubacteriales bacterium]